MVELSSNLSAEPNAYVEVVSDVLPETTLFIHGNVASRRWWYPMRDLWLAKASQQGPLSGDMILVDFRGCGRARAPQSPQDVQVPVMVNDIFEQLQRKGYQKPLHVVGHSTGGALALTFMAQRPEYFKKAVLLDSVGLRGVFPEPIVHRVYESMKSDRALTAEIVSRTIYNNDIQSDFFQKVILEDAMTGVQKTGDWVVRALTGIDLTEQVSKIQHPVLVLHGDQDLLLPQADSQEIARHLSHGKFVVLENQGHCCNVENPSRLVGVVEQFLFS